VNKDEMLNKAYNRRKHLFKIIFKRPFFS